MLVASTRPGNRLPHAWLERDNQRLSTLDLVDVKSIHWLLITDSKEIGRWREAASQISYPIDVVEISVSGKEEGAYQDADGAWDKVSGVREGGAVLVRTDNHVAWRTTELDIEGLKEAAQKLFRFA
jgi:2,4-dichlorophenol 6-monooxygenase